MNWFLRFFAHVGKGLIKVFKVIDQIVPEEQLLKGLELVEVAAVKFATSPEKRAWVIQELQKLFPIGESVARLITELAVAQVKHGIEAGINDVEAHITKDGQ